MKRPSILISSLVVCLAIPASHIAAQERVVVGGGPPPEVRSHLDAFIKAVNADASQWEAMAKEHFTPGLLNRRPAEERQKLHAAIRRDFGTVSSNRITRRGPGAPLEINVRGSSGVDGVITLTLETASPFRIDDIGVDVGKLAGDERGGGPPPPPIDGTMSTDDLRRVLDAHLSKLAADEVFSGVVLVAKDGKPVFEKAYGFADRARRIPNTIATRFNVGSINKTFTQLAAGQLVAQGKLALTDTLGKFFPEYPQETTRAATIQQLLDHSAGIADFFGDEFARTSKDRFRSNADYFHFVSRLPPLFAPGARNQYCNGCYIALGAVIEKVSGLPYERYVADHIFKPAGMTNTGYPQTDSLEPDVAMGYTRRTADGTLRSNVFMHGAAGSAAGGGYSTAADLLAYANARRTGAFKQAGGDGLGIAGGAPGTSAVLESGRTWTVVVLSNLDPPTGERIGAGIMEQLQR
jgi:CubicO group peptidase (beta-lactamase class C family)